MTRCRRTIALRPGRAPMSARRSPRGRLDYSASGQTFYRGTGSGADVYGANDQSHYAYQTLNGDGSIVARVRYQTESSAWAKAGVMIRQSGDPAGSNFVDALVRTRRQPEHAQLQRGGLRRRRLASAPLPPVVPTTGYGVADAVHRARTRPPGRTLGRLHRTEQVGLKAHPGAGNTFTSYESADGHALDADWRRDGGDERTGHHRGCSVTRAQTSARSARRPSTTSRSPRPRRPPPPGPPCRPPWADTERGPSPAHRRLGQPTTLACFTVNGAGVPTSGAPTTSFNYVNQPLGREWQRDPGRPADRHDQLELERPRAGIMIKQSTTAGSNYLMISSGPAGQHPRSSTTSNGSTGGGTYHPSRTCG